jgi:hypothetical protein
MSREAVFPDFGTPNTQKSYQSNILSISNSNPCVVEIDVNPGYVTNDFVRLTDLNGAMPNPRGQDPLNNYRWKITMITDTTFFIKYPVTDLPVDSTNYTPYVEGGFCNLIQTNFEYLNDGDNNG